MYQNLFKSSTSFIQKHNKNILKEIEYPKNVEQPQLLNKISNINKEITGKYENLIYNYEEIIVQPFNIFASSYQTNFNIQARIVF